MLGIRLDEDVPIKIVMPCREGTWLVGGRRLSSCAVDTRRSIADWAMQSRSRIQGIRDGEHAEKLNQNSVMRESSARASENTITS
jgi:hypothetical protein